MFRLYMHFLPHGHQTSSYPKPNCKFMIVLNLTVGLGSITFCSVGILYFVGYLYIVDRINAR